MITFWLIAHVVLACMFCVMGWKHASDGNMAAAVLSVFLILVNVGGVVLWGLNAKRAAQEAESAPAPEAPSKSSIFYCPCQEK